MHPIYLLIDLLIDLFIYRAINEKYSLVPLLKLEVNLFVKKP